MPETIHLYTKESSLVHLERTVGLLCELAPDSPLLGRAGEVYRADEMLGSADAALLEAYKLISKLLYSTVAIEGFPLLSVFEESLLEQCSYLVQTFHLDRWISDRKFATCRFISDSPWLDRLRRVREINNSDYQLTSDVPVLHATATGKVVQKLLNSRPSLTEFLRRVTPLWWRHLSAIRLRKQARNLPKDAIWFYSTAYNYTKIALEYEEYLPGKLNFLVEDPTTGGKPLRDLRKPCQVLYAWSRVADIPSTSEANSIGRQITDALMGVSLAGSEIPLREALLKSEWYQHFLTRLLPFAIYNGRVLKRWRQATAPKMVLVGNAAWERVLLLNENFKHVPAVMLQHGIMHWVYSVSDQPVDVFLLRGAFFQHVISDNLRKKTVICNSPTSIVPAALDSRNTRDSVLFITAPYDVLPLFHREDLRDIVRSLLRVCHARGCPLIIRIHPMERVSDYQRAVSELETQLNLSVNVVYSQGSGAEEVLSRACAAVLHFSTMFLDCLRHGIPIVSFGWHWFPYKGQFEEEHVFNFASDLRSLENLVNRGIEGSLPFRSEALEEFSAPSEPKEITKLFSTMIGRR